VTIRLHVDHLAWDEWNRTHIAKHAVNPEEAEEVATAGPVIRATYKERFQLIGPTLAGRLLTVIVGENPEKPGVYYVFSARPASRKPTVDLGYPTPVHGRIPSFANIEEEAEFWDTHDVTDYLDESEPAELTVGSDLAEKLTLRLDQRDRDALRRRARAMGIGPSTLARIWLKERLRQEEEAEATVR
jgi:uncharacterized DUF497 family protein